VSAMTLSELFRRIWHPVGFGVRAHKFRHLGIVLLTLLRPRSEAGLQAGIPVPDSPLWLGHGPTGLKEKQTVRHLIFKFRFLGIVAFAMLVGVWPMAAQAATAPSLGTAAGFAVLGASTVTCTGPSRIVGDVGVSPGSAITGFPPCQLTGTFHSADAVSLQAQADATTAYNQLVGATCPAANNLTGKDLGGMTLSPGVYCFSSSAQLTGTLNLSSGGVYIFQIGSTLTTASGSSVLISNAQPCGASSNVFWQVGSSATLGTTTAFAGNILALASITMTTGASLDGRAIALTGAVTMDTNTISTCGQTGRGGNGHRTHCNQGVGNGPEGCDPGNSNQGNPSRSNDELGGTPGAPGRQGGNGK
jgi:Ice-binding-like